MVRKQRRQSRDVRQKKQRSCSTNLGKVEMSKQKRRRRPTLQKLLPKAMMRLQVIVKMKGKGSRILRRALHLVTACRARVVMNVKNEFL